MYKEFAISESSQGLVGVQGENALSWGDFWSSLPLPTERQVATVATTFQWKMIRPHIRPGMRFLEAGCGLGAWVRFVVGQGLEPIGLDFSRHLLSRLHREFPHFSWLAGDVRSLGVASDSVDILVSWGVVEHDEAGPAQALAEFHRVLKRGGRAFITVPWLSAWRRINGMRQGGDNKHITPDGAIFHQHYFETEEFSDLVRAAGFTIEAAQPYGGQSTILPKGLRQGFPTMTKIFKRTLGRVIPSSIFGHMLFVVARKDG